jgi:integrase
MKEKLYALKKKFSGFETDKSFRVSKRTLLDEEKRHPVPGWVKDRLDLWTQSATITEGKIFRAVGKNDKVSAASLSTTAVWKIVLHYAHEVGIEHLAPHDLRRTCEKLCQKSGGDLEQIQFLLGHSSIQATEK